MMRPTMIAAAAATESIGFQLKAITFVEGVLFFSFISSSAQA
jgi:hypothetical protein